MAAQSFIGLMDCTHGIIVKVFNVLPGMPKEGKGSCHNTPCHLVDRGCYTLWIVSLYTVPEGLCLWVWVHSVYNQSGRAHRASSTACIAVSSSAKKLPADSSDRIFCTRSPTCVTCLKSALKLWSSGPASMLTKDEPL